MRLPATVLINYIRIYKQTDSQNVSCNPKGNRTADYIANYTEAYNSAYPSPPFLIRFFCGFVVVVVVAVDEDGVDGSTAIVDPS